MKVKTLHKIAFEQNCKKLFSKLDNKADLVVGVLNGGGYVLDEFKKNNSEANTIYETIKLQRSSTKGIKQSSFIQKILPLLSYSVLNIIRKYEYNKVIKKTTFKINASLPIHFKIKDEAESHILVVDDALDTGVTMASVVQSLRNKFPEVTIQTAVIAWTNPGSILVPDYYVFKDELVRFPWSLDYKTKRHG